MFSPFVYQTNTERMELFQKWRALTDGPVAPLGYLPNQTVSQLKVILSQLEVKHNTKIPVTRTKGRGRLVATQATVRANSLYLLV